MFAALQPRVAVGQKFNADRSCEYAEFTSSALMRGVNCMRLCCCLISKFVDIIKVSDNRRYVSSAGRSAPLRAIRLVSNPETNTKRSTTASSAGGSRINKMSGRVPAFGAKCPTQPTDTDFDPG